MEVLDVLIKWLVQNASSNVDLARLSNVNRTWRSHVIAAILEQAQEGTPRLLLPSMVNFIFQQSPSEEETFCASWFAPAGIQIQSISKLGDTWDTEVSDNLFAPNGEQYYPGSEEERSSVRMDIIDQAEGPICSHEWKGFREPMDVLEPFGYTSKFVEVSEALFESPPREHAFVLVSKPNPSRLLARRMLYHWQETARWRGYQVKRKTTV